MFYVDLNNDNEQQQQQQQEEDQQSQLNNSLNGVKFHTGNFILIFLLFCFLHLSWFCVLFIKSIILLLDSFNHSDSQMVGI